MQISEEDRELAAKAVFMTAIESAMKACREMKLGPSATMVGMITTVTAVIRMLFDDLRKDED